MVGRPIVRQSAQARNLGDLARPALFFFIFPADSFGCLRRVDSGALCVNLPKRRMVLNALVEPRLRDSGVVNFAVAVAAIADNVHHNVAAELRAIFRGEVADAHDSVGVFRVDVENRDRLPFGKVRSKARGMLLRRQGGETDKVVHDDVNRAAYGVGLEVGEIERFCPNTLAGKGSVTMHDDRDDLISAARAVAGLLGARTPHGDGINRFQVAGIRNQVDANLFAGGGDIGAGRADVILHVARAKHAARVNIFKAGDDFVRGLARRVNHHV